MESIFNDLIKPKALELLMRAELPTDQEKAEFRKGVFLKELESYKYQNSNGEIIIQDLAGFDVQDPHGYNLTVDQFVKSEFDKYFDLSNLPINEAECISRLKDPKITPSERKKITDQWGKIKNR